MEGSIDRYLMNVENIQFLQGLEGVPEWKLYNLQQTQEMMPIALLQSTEESKVSFIVANPFAWFPAYRLEISEEEMAQLKAEKVEDLYILAIINVESDPFQVTANLLAPLLINPHSRLGMQKVLHLSGYKARHPLNLRTLKVNFPEGLLGLSEYRDFILQSADELAPVFLLTSQEEQNLSFPMVDPLILDPKYVPDVEEADLQALGSPDVKDLQMFVLLNVQNNPFRATANLMAPLIVNMRSGVGRQVLLSQSQYQVAHPLNLGKPGMGRE